MQLGGTSVPILKRLPTLAASALRRVAFLTSAGVEEGAVRVLRCPCIKVAVHVVRDLQSRHSASSV
jgi:hypothetical protein